MNSLDSITKAVSEYLAEPSRSERAIVVRKLNEAGFFSATTVQDMEKALKTVLEQYGRSCPSGADRAREFLTSKNILLGEDMKTTIRVIVDLDVEGMKAGELDWLIVENMRTLLRTSIQNGDLKPSPTGVQRGVKLTGVKWQSFKVGDLGPVPAL